jgi:hypothetical protein
VFLDEIDYSPNSLEQTEMLAGQLIHCYVQPKLLRTATVLIISLSWGENFLLYTPRALILCFAWEHPQHFGYFTEALYKGHFRRFV